MHFRVSIIEILLYTQRDHPPPSQIVHACDNWVEAKILLNPNIFMHIQTSDLRQLMLNTYVVICAGSLLRHAVDMLSLCVYKNLYGVHASQASIVPASSVRTIRAKIIA